MIRLALALIVFPILLVGCSIAPEKPPLDGYRLSSMQHLQQQDVWSLEGRLALIDEKDSVSVSIFWRHDGSRDDIELVGPLAQGRLKISVLPGQVIVDDGDSKVAYPGRAEAVLSQQLGVDMPVSSLRFWVLGVNDPEQEYLEQPGGFYQAGWLIRYREMQVIASQMLPKKLTAEKDKARIKLIVDQWVF